MRPKKERIKEAFYINTDRDVKDIFMKINHEQFAGMTNGDVLTYLMMQFAKLTPAERVQTVISGQQEYLRLHYARRGIGAFDLDDYLNDITPDNQAGQMSIKFEQEAAAG